MSNAAYVKKVQVSTDSGTTWLDLPATSPSMDIGGDILDDTEMATNAGYRTRCYGLHDWSISADCNWSSAQAALVAVRAAKLARTDILVQYLPTGTADGTGLQGTCVVESFNQSGDVGGLETVSISLQGDGALTAV